MEKKVTNPKPYHILAGQRGGATNVKNGWMSELGKISGAKVRQCPHCGYSCKGVTIFRYHFDKCKYKCNCDEVR